MILIRVQFRLLFNRLIPVLNESEIEYFPDFVTVFSFKKYMNKETVKKFCSSIHIQIPAQESSINPFTLLFKFILSIIQFIRKFKDKFKKQTMSLIPPLCETLYQIFEPIALVHLRKNLLYTARLNFLENSLLLSTVIKLRHILLRQLDFIISDSSEQYLGKTFLEIVSLRWNKFSFDILVKIESILLGSKTNFEKVESIGHYAILKISSCVHSHGVFRPRFAHASFYNDPVFESLHMLIPKLVLNFHGLIYYFEDIQQSAGICHPLYFLELPLPFAFRPPRRPTTTVTRTLESIEEEIVEKPKQSNNVQSKLAYINIDFPSQNLPEFPLPLSWGNLQRMTRTGHLVNSRDSLTDSNIDSRISSRYASQEKFLDRLYFESPVMRTPRTQSIENLQLLQDWALLPNSLRIQDDSWNHRAEPNFPGNRIDLSFLNNSSAAVVNNSPLIHSSSLMHCRCYKPKLD